MFTTWPLQKKTCHLLSSCNRYLRNRPVFSTPPWDEKSNRSCILPVFSRHGELSLVIHQKRHYPFSHYMASDQKSVNQREKTYIHVPVPNFKSFNTLGNHFLRHSVSIFLTCKLSFLSQRVVVMNKWFIKPLCKP